MRESKETLLTLEDAKNHGVLAPVTFANEIIEAGLAKRPEDVVLVGQVLFSRAYMPSGEAAPFYLRAGQVMDGER